MRARVVLFLACLAFAAHSSAATVEYEFSIDHKIINVTGQVVEALAIDDQIPAPTIRANVGDVLRVTFHNRLDEESTVHWHGILLPADQDGVAHLNTRPIAPGGSHTFEFPILHTGTFWYHSHTDLQIQKGLYGAVVLKSGEEESALQDEVVLFSDWTDESVDRILHNLKSEDDYYSFDRGSVQSWDRVLANGTEAVVNRLRSSFDRMPPMDLADVHYDTFLVNGAIRNELAVADPAAEQIKLRLINGSTSSYFDVEYAGGPMTIIAADGQDVEPIRVQRLRISTAETYDVMVPLEAGLAFELRATSFDGTGHSSLFVGAGTPVAAPDIPRPNLFLTAHDMMAMDHSASPAIGMPGDAPTPGAMPDHEAHSAPAPAAAVDHSAHAPAPTAVDHSAHTAPVAEVDHSAHMAMSDMSSPGAVIAHMTDYEALIARRSSVLDPDQEWREISLTLSGSMERYVWGFDDKTMRESPQILIRKGENVRMHLTNDTMMHHPLHLHGHFFRVLNQHGERSPLKHTVNIPPMGHVTIEFDANEEQDWLFHCHNQYHMKSGMNRVVSYEETSKYTPEIGMMIHPGQRWFGVQEFHLMSAFADYEFSLFDERHEFRFELDTDLSETYEVHAMYAYHFNRLVSAFVGTESREHHHDDNHDIAIAGVNVLLPLLVESQWRFDDHGDFRLELKSEIPITRTIGVDWRWNTDNEYRYGINFRLNNRWAVTIHTDTEYGDGVGVKFFY